MQLTNFFPLTLAALSGILMERLHLKAFPFIFLFIVLYQLKIEVSDITCVLAKYLEILNCSIYLVKQQLTCGR